jgi:hypothetical protein
VLGTSFPSKGCRNRSIVLLVDDARAAILKRSAGSGRTIGGASIAAAFSNGAKVTLVWEPGVVDGGVVTMGPED